MPKTGVEYASDQITIYDSCIFRCKYCWNRLPIMQSRISRRKYSPIDEAMKYTRSRKPRTIVISFVNDPYQPREITERKTRKVLEILLQSPIKHRIMILTKNPKLALDRDFELMNNNVWLGSTVTALCKIPDEPYAPSNVERIEVLLEAHQGGIHTWMSIEPWIPNVTKPTEIINYTHEFIDLYIVGRLNYAKQLGYNHVTDGFYRKALPDVISLLKKLKKPFIIKKELKKVMSNV